MHSFQVTRYLTLTLTHLSLCCYSLTILENLIICDHNYLPRSKCVVFSIKNVNHECLIFTLKS